MRIPGHGDHDSEVMAITYCPQDRNSDRHEFGLAAPAALAKRGSSGEEEKPRVATEKAVDAQDQKSSGPEGPRLKPARHFPQLRGFPKHRFRLPGGGRRSRRAVAGGQPMGGSRDRAETLSASTGARVLAQTPAAGLAHHSTRLTEPPGTNLAVSLGRIPDRPHRLQL